MARTRIRPAGHGRFCPGDCLVAACRADSVIMKNGIVYRSQGAPDRDNTLLYIADGLKRVVVRDSKVERIEANNAVPDR